MLKINSSLQAQYTYKGVTITYNKLIDIAELLYDYPELLGMIRRQTTGANASIDQDTEITGVKLFDFARSRILEIDGVEDEASESGQLQWGSLSDEQRRHVALQISLDPDYTALWSGFITEIMSILSVTQAEVGE